MKGAGTSLAATRQVAGTVLVVEDHEANRALLTHLLESEGFRVHALADGEARLAAVATVDPDLILLDVRLPGLDGDGLDLAAEVRASARPAVRIVVVSASVLPAERSRAIDRGADAFLGKPFGATDLIDALVALAPGA